MTSYDRMDWHLDSASEAGQPEENAFTHIGLYLAWLIRHDLHDPSIFPSDHIEAVKRGEMTGSDLADDIDGKLIGQDMTAEGRAFSDARYEAYLGEYGELFDDVPEYGVEDGPAAYERVEPLLDLMYADWVKSGRPGPPERTEPVLEVDDFPPTSRVMVPEGLDHKQLDELLAYLPGDVQVLASEAVGPRSHVAPELEALIPKDLTSPPMDVESDLASSWGSSLLTRATKRLGIAPKDAVVVHGMGGGGDATLTVTIYGLPGIRADALASEFRSVIFRLPGTVWKERNVEGHQVIWASGHEFTVAFWARDGLVIHVTGQPEPVIAAIGRLP
ncbi:MAG TPA: hypothetical protein VFN41_08600 [Candidatus Limnocylindrales bacterium]|nr:hypothetical protein [Candidatus Limnocylindrales bacterium]